LGIRCGFGVGFRFGLGGGKGPFLDSDPGVMGHEVAVGHTDAVPRGADLDRLQHPRALHLLQAQARPPTSALFSNSSSERPIDGRPVWYIPWI